MPELLSPERIFDLGGRVPARLVDGVAPAAGTVLGSLPLPAWEQWERNVAHVTGRTPSRAARRRLAEQWIRNNAWSMSLARWSDTQVLARARITDEEAASLHESLAGPGLVLALPHMGSWDFAGAWAARQGIEVVSVAERLPRGLYDRFRDARAAMGIHIHPMGERGLMGSLERHVAGRRMVCLLADRDLGRQGVDVSWPSGRSSTMAPGPAMLAQRTGADLRVVTCHYERSAVRLRISEQLDTTGTVAEITQRIADGFAAAIDLDPTNWLVLQPLVR